MTAVHQACSLCARRRPRPKPKPAKVEMVIVPLQPGRKI